MSGLSHTPGKRAWGKTHRGFESRLLRQKVKTPQRQSVAGFFIAQVYFVVCAIFMAEAMKAETSPMLLGMIRVVVASAASRL